MKKKRFKRWFVLLAALLVILLVVVPKIAHKIECTRYPQKYSESVEKWAAEYQIDPNILYAVIRTESSFNPQAESNVGARGLMQMTEETFHWIKSKIASQEPLDFDSLYDPDTSIRFGAYFMDQCMERYNGDLSTAAAAYHSGWGTVDKLLDDAAYTSDGITLSEYPYPQMNRYVYKINRSYQKYVSLYGAQ